MLQLGTTVPPPLLKLAQVIGESCLSQRDKSIHTREVPSTFSAKNFNKGKLSIDPIRLGPMGTANVKFGDIRPLGEGQRGQQSATNALAFS